MKKSALLIIIAIILAPIVLNAQCKDFTENEALPLLGDFVLSGRYNSVKLSEGEEMLIFKTLNKGINYRFIVKASTDLPKNIEFEISDWDGKILFSNKENGFQPIWDYASPKTQRVKVYVKVPVLNKSKEPLNGCVSLITGIKKD